MGRDVHCRFHLDGLATRQKHLVHLGPSHYKASDRALSVLRLDFKYLLDLSRWVWWLSEAMGARVALA